MTYRGVTYPDRLVLVHVQGETWEVVADYRCRWEGGEITVPAGTKTDLASVPRLFRWLVPVVGDQNGAAVVHDRCYEVQTILPRAEADALFLAGMKAAGVGWARRWAMYAAVRVGGWVPWGQRAREIERERAVGAVPG
ncbi:MAG: hypothetical protein VR70_06220 [Rhodospirillaceae bacterium BRH_c57]|nr:MAG: hypothetical protein VR70_06220 [Rhodospirillaceae bacterium BRH_c57]